MKLLSIAAMCLVLISSLLGDAEAKVFTKKLKFKATYKTDFHWIARYAFTSKSPLDFKINVRFIKSYPGYTKLNPETKIYIIAADSNTIDRLQEAMEGHVGKTYNGT